MSTEYSVREREHRVTEPTMVIDYSEHDPADRKAGEPVTEPQKKETATQPSFCGHNRQPTA